MEVPLKRRYPGIRAFEQTERLLFFGREQEQKKLLAMVKVNPLVVLFSKSGIGKSSIINAGLIPALDADFFQSVRMRLQDTAIAPILIAKGFLEPYVNQERLNKFCPGGYEKATLWETLQACIFERAGEKVIPVLIFDQFEEFFDHDKDLRMAFIAELSDIVNGRLPLELQNRFRSIPFKERNEEIMNWFSPIPVRVLLAIRSDKISFLDEMALEISSILNSRFHLRPLLKTNAEAAIVEPAQLPDKNLDTPPFRYEPNALEKVLNYLSNKEDEIESFQLQLLCQYIENLIRENYHNRENVVITSKDFGGEAGINHILNDYYENELKKLTPEERVLAQHFLEEGLIVNGKRVGVTEGVEKEQHHIDSVLLKKLLESRLIRAENTHLGRSFEISHDTLVPPILESYKRRKLEEEQKAKEKAFIEEQARLKAQRLDAERKLKEEQDRSYRERMEAQAKLEEEQKRLAREQTLKRRANKFATFSIVLFAIALVAAIWAMNSYRQAKEQKDAAVSQRTTADSLRRSVSHLYDSLKTSYSILQTTQENLSAEQKNAQDLQYRKFMAEGKSNLEQKLYDEAVQSFEKALFYKPYDTEALFRKETAASLASKNQLFETLIREADAALAKGAEYYETALNKYLQAQRLGIKSPELPEKIKTVQVKMEQAYDKFRKDGDIFFNAGGYRFALDNYLNAQKIGKRINKNSIDLDKRIQETRAKLEAGG